MYSDKVFVPQNARQLIQIIHFINRQRKVYVQNQIFIPKEHKFEKYSLDNLLYYLNLTGSIGINIIRDCFLGKAGQLIIVSIDDLLPKTELRNNLALKLYHCFHILEYDDEKGTHFKLFSHSHRFLLPQSDYGEFKMKSLKNTTIARLYTLPTTLLDYFNDYTIPEIVAYCHNKKIKPKVL